MKKIVFIILFTAFYISLFSQSSDDLNFRLGLGTSYVSEVESTSLSIKGIYEITEKWEVALTYSHVFKNLGLSWDIIDLDGHYVFYNNDKKLSAYALAGFALNFWRRDTLLTKETLTGSYMGMNIGAAMNIGMGKHFFLTPEIRGTLFDLSYTRIGVTFQYLF